ncbi:MAG: pitrilysin family protein [Myxococcota bacterium]
MRPMPDSPVASVQLWFDAGAVDEDPSIAGAAHFVEHMLFKGTERRAVGEAAAAIEAAGGDLNAWTSWDETCFHATLEASNVRDALDVVFDMTGASVLDAGELEREKQVVLEEIRGYEDDPDSVAADRLQSLLFGEHPYGRPVIGFPTTVTGLDRAAVQGFWRQNYHPARAVLAVAGPVELREVLGWVDPLVARWPAGSPRRTLPATHPAPSTRIERLERDFGSVVVQLGWPGPGIGHPDAPALDVLVQALGQGAASRLGVLLDLERGVASHVWCDAMAWAGGGLLGAGFLCGETEQAIGLAVGELARVVRDGLPGSVVARARDSILADLLFSTETAEGVAADLAWSVARRDDPRHDRWYAAQVAAVTAERVREVARTWFDLDRMQMVVIDKDLTTRKLRSVVDKARKLPVAKPIAKNAVVDVSRGGLRIVALPDAGRIAAIHVTGYGGQLLEGPRSAGASEAWSRLVLRGAGPYDATELAERSDALALALDASAGRSAFSIQASFPATDLDASLDLVGHVLVEPHLADEDWDNVREEILDDQAAQVDRPSAVATDLLWRALWPDHPWRLPSLGTAATIERLGTKALWKHHQAQIAKDNLVITVAGGLDPYAVADRLEAALEPLAAAATIPERTAGPAPGSTRVAKRAGNEQAIVVVGVRGVPIGHPDRTALALASHLLDAQSGRLFLKLREQRGLAYGVWAASETGIDGGVFSAGLATDPARVDEAVDALVAELAALASDPPDEVEVDRTRKMMYGLAAMRHQRVSARASDLAWSTRFGQPYGLDALKQRLTAVTPTQVRDALRALAFGDAVRVLVRPKG